MGNILPKLHQVNGIEYNNGLNATYGGTITSSNAYHKVTKWFLHHMNGLVLFRKYTQSLDTLELSILIPFCSSLPLERYVCSSPRHHC